MYAPTANGASLALPERTTPKITRIRPMVATTSPSHNPPSARDRVDQETSSSSNIRLAMTAPPIAPPICAVM